MFRVQRLTKKFGRKTVFINAVFECDYGHIAGLLGKNGAGKTTFFDCLTGVTDCEILDADELKKIRFSYMPRFDLYEWNDTVEDMSRLLPVICEGFDGDYFNEKIKELGIDPKAKISSFSTGQKVALDFVIALSKRADVYLFDEPFANLDAHFREFIKRELIGNISDDKLFIVSTHDIAEFDAVFSRIAIIKDHCFTKTFDCEKKRTVLQ